MNGLHTIWKGCPNVCYSVSSSSERELGRRRCTPFSCSNVLCWCLHILAYVVEHVYLPVVIGHCDLSLLVLDVVFSIVFLAYHYPLL